MCENVDAWINRKGHHSQNILAACSFDMKFTYMLAGYEGSTHDARMLDAAIEFHGFPIPPPGKNNWQLTVNESLRCYFDLNIKLDVSLIL